MRRLVSVVVAVVLVVGAVPGTASARAVLSDSTAEGLDILAGVVEEQGVDPVTGGGSASVAVSDTTDTGLVVSLPKSGDGLVWLDDPYGFDLGLGLPTAGSRSETYCPMDGWYLRDGMCLRRIAFGYVYAPLEYDYLEYEYDYLDYTYQEQDYGYATQTPSTHLEVVDYRPVSHAYAADTAQSTGTLCPWGGDPNPQGDLCIVDDGVEEVWGPVNDEPPAGWEWNDDWTLWRQMLPVPAGWFDSGWNWQRRDDTPAGWEDYGDEFQWRRLITTPMDEDGYEHTPAGDRWRRLIDKPGWTLMATRWQHLAPSPEGYVVDDLSWVITVPARQRQVPLDAPPGPDTSTVEVIHPAPVQAPGADLLGEWDTDTALDADTGDGGVIDLAGGTTGDVQGDGTVVYDGGSDAGSVAGQVLSDGSVRLAVTIPDADAPRSFAVPLTMPNYMAPALQPDGRVLVMGLLALDDPATSDVDEELWEIEFEMPAPWAKDANGADVRTWYTMDGNVLTQHIEPTASTVWPVVADPTAKQNKLAAKARTQATVAEKQADKAAAARKQAIAAQEKAAKAAAAAEAKLLAARTNAKKREDLARQAKEKAKAAKEQMELAKAKAKEAAEAAKKAAEAAKKASKAAQALAATNAKKLASQASKAAKAATTASTNARQSATIADTAAITAVLAKESIQDSLKTAKATLAVYDDKTLTAKQKIAATQPMLNLYADRVVERKTIAANGTKTAVTPGVEGRSLKSADRTDAQLWANIAMEYLVSGRTVGFITLGGDADTVDVTVRVHNTGSTSLDHALSFTLRAPAAVGDPDSASRISSRMEFNFTFSTTPVERKGCDGDGPTATCVIPGIKAKEDMTFGFRLLANPRQTRDYSGATLAATGGPVMILPVTLLQNRYQTDFDSDGRVEYLDHTIDGPDGLPSVRPEPLTVGVYGPLAATGLLQQAEEIADAEHQALTACGYGKTAKEYLAQWYRELPNGDRVLKVHDAGEGIGLVGTIKGSQYAAIEAAFMNVNDLVGKGAPLRRIADGMAIIGDIVNVGEAAGAYGLISCAAGARLALAALGRQGPVGLVLSLATEQFLHLAADGNARNQVWFAQLRAGAKAGCTRIEWRNEDGRPRVAFAQTKPVAGVFELEGSKAPHNDVGQRWVVSCKRVTS